MVQVTIKQIKPKKGINRKLVDEMSASIGRSVSELMRTQAKRTVQSWESKPEIKTERSTTGDEIIVKLMIESWAKDIWDILDKGSPPHKIEPLNSKFLVFRQSGFAAKTTPGVFSSKPGKKASGDLQFRKSVNHPGTEARKWSEMMKERAEKKIRAETKKAMAKLRKNPGG